MMRLSDSIEQFIKELLSQESTEVELKRNELAESFGCAPSQINYVLATRFSPDHGYLTESRRGGGGYIRIVRVPMTKSSYLMHFFQAVGETMEENEAKACLKNLADAGIITAREAGLAMAAMSQRALDKVSPELRSAVRADVMRHMLMMLMM